MKKLFLPFLVLLFVSSCSNKVELLNDTDLENWTVFVSDDTDPASVFSVSDGILHVAGKPHAYICTKEVYSSYTLHLEWRWVGEPSNSGVLIHKTGEDMIWPNCIEAQLMAGNAGDLVLIGKGSGISVDGNAHLILSEENRYEVIAKKHDSSELEPGEWNSYDITVSESEISLSVNGILQNTGTDPTKTSGHICIQSEGSGMEFRNIKLVLK